MTTGYDRNPAPTRKKDWAGRSTGYDPYPATAPARNIAPPPPAPVAEAPPWWKKDRPESRTQFTKADGSLNNNYAMQAQQVTAPDSRISELDARMGSVSPVNFNNAGNTAAAGGLNQLHAKAWDNNQSQAALAQNALVNNNMNRQIDRNNITANGALANARNDMAAGGGLSGGGRQQLGMAGMRQRMMANAGAHGDATSGKLNIASQDWQQKNALQNQLPSQYMQMGAAQTDTDKYNSNQAMDKVNVYKSQQQAEDTRAMDASQSNVKNNMAQQQFNIGNAMADKNADTTFAMDKWKTQNAAIGGEKTADSQNYYADQQSKKGIFGNSGGFLGTGFGA
jgi:hypothetical protein